MSQDQQSGVVARESTKVKTRRRYDAKYESRILEEWNPVPRAVFAAGEPGSIFSST